MSEAKYKHLAVVFGIALLLSALAVFLFFDPIRGEICTKSEVTGQMGCDSYPIALVMLWDIAKSLNDFAPAITALAATFIAWFGFALYRSAGALHVATDALWTVSQEQAALTQRTLAELERPWLFVDLSPWILSASAQTRLPHVLFTVVNHGRAPGIVHLMQANFSTGLRPGVGLREYDDFSGTAFGAGREWKDCVAIADEEFRGRLQERGQHMIPGFEDESLFFTVQIEYTDAPGNPHTSRFGWRFDLAKERWVGLRDPDWFFAD
jgi:hypothetical protein